MPKMMQISLNQPLFFTSKRTDPYFRDRGFLKSVQEYLLHLDVLSAIFIKKSKLPPAVVVVTIEPIMPIPCPKL